MSRVLIVNPNTNQMVTRCLAEEARRVAPPGVEIVAINAASGLAALQTPQDVATAARAVIEAIAAEPGLHGAVIAAFGDPGLAEARARFSIPIVGLGECGLRAASAGGRRFCVVTLGAAMRDPIARRAAALGLDEIVVPPFSIAQMIAERDARRAEIVEAVRGCRSEVALLGGAPFAGLAQGIARETGKIVLDGVEACLAAIVAEMNLPPRCGF